MSRVSLDDADIRILGILQEDATLSIANVAVKANMSQNACWRRIKRLEESGVIARRVTLLDAGALGLDLTVADVLRLYPNVPHGRLPVWEKNPDRIIGLVRRRDLLKAAGEDRHATKVRELMGKAHIVPENANLSDALHDLVRNHQQLAVVVDEFGAFAGVITLEDVFESLLGIEIYEKDDPHPDMRELARQRGHRVGRRSETPPKAGT